MKTYFCLLANALLLSCAQASAAQYCSIEVGSKGVKARLFEMSVTDGGILTKTLYDKDTNTTIISSLKDNKFSAEAITETADAVSRRLTEMVKLSPDCQKVVVGSSGVAKAANRNELADAVTERTQVRDVDFINPTQEAEFAFYSSVRPKDRPSALLLDVGSGNTKMGYYNPSEQRFLAVEIPYGSVTLTKKANDQGLPTFRQGYAKVIATEVLPNFKDAMQSRPGVSTRKLVYWVGGAAWATATYTHPEAALAPSLKLSQADLDEFLVALEAKKWTDKVAPANLSAETRRVFEADYSKVKDIFTSENLMSGVGVAKMVLSEGVGGRTLLFPRNGQWLYGYVLEKFKLDK